jgi:hypothetical protein
MITHVVLALLTVCEDVDPDVLFACKFACVLDSVAFSRPAFSDGYKAKH